MVTGEEAEVAKSTDGRPEDGVHVGPVPRLSMDYFYLSDRSQEEKKGGQALSTK